MLNQFSRTALLLGEEGVERLHGSRVIVFGIGGVGGHAVEALVRAGVGAIDIVDNDDVSLTNLNRQLIATWDTIGKRKVDVMEERIKSVNPECKVVKHACFYLPETRDEFDFSSYDYVIDAIDTVSAKLDIAVAAHETGVRHISSMGTGNKLDPTQLEVADISETSVCRLAKVMRKELRRRGIEHMKCVYSKEEPIKLDQDTPGAEMKGRGIAPGSTSFVPSVAGLIIAAEVAKDIAFERYGAPQRKGRSNENDQVSSVQDKVAERKRPGHFRSICARETPINAWFMGRDRVPPLRNQRFCQSHAVSTCSNQHFPTRRRACRCTSGRASSP